MTGRLWRITWPGVVAGLVVHAGVVVEVRATLVARGAHGEPL